MTTPPSIFKRAYDTVALFALLNVLAVGGLVGYLVGSGVLDVEKGRRLVSVMRGEDLTQTETTPAETPADATTEPTETPTAGEAVAESQMDIEIMRREGERIKAELDQRLALNNSILLRVMTERERFQREQEEAAKQQKASRKQRGEEGFKKQLAILEALNPKIAVQHLLAVSDPDDAARILLEIDTRKAKKIVESAKSGDEIEKMKLILRRVREVAPEQSAELASEEP